MAEKNADREDHYADFGDEMLRFAVFMKLFSRSLTSCRDRPLQITNNLSELSQRIKYLTSRDPKGCLLVKFRISLVRVAKIKTFGLKTPTLYAVTAEAAELNNKKILKKTPCFSSQRTIMKRE